MNRVYKIIWSKVRQSFAVVSECSRTQGKGGVSDTRRARAAVLGIETGLIASAMVLLFSGQVLALPGTNLGHSTTTGNSGIAIGSQNTTSPSFGDPATADGTNAIAIGSNALANGEQTVALGSKGTEATGEQSIAIGGDTVASGADSIAIGGDDLDRVANDNPPPWNATGLTNAGFNTSATAIQYHDQTGQWLVDVTGGPATRYIKTEANGAGSVVLGVQSKATGALATAIGTGSRAEAFASTAFGIGSKATKENSVALGAGATTVTDAEAIDDATVGTGADAVTYSGFAGDDNVIAGDQVSVGAAGYERQIKHVAPGAITETSTDAINGSQLFVITKDIQDNIKESTQTYFHFNDPNMTQGVGDVANNLGGVTDTAGAEGDYSVTAGFGAGATGEGGIAIGYKATSTGDNAVVLGGNGTNSATGGYATSMGLQTTASGDHSTATGHQTTASGTSSTAMGWNTTASGADAVAMGNTTVASGTSAVAMGWNTLAQGADSVAMGSGSQALGASSTAMGAGSQAIARNSLATQGGIAYTENSIAIGDGTVAGQGGGNQQAVAMGYGSQATANQSMALGFGAQATHENSVALGQGAVTKPFVQVSTATVGGVTYGGFAGTADGVVSVGAGGSEKQIVNVAPGEISETSTDAINGSQLWAFAQSNSGGWNITANGKDSSNVGPGATVDFNNSDGNILISKDGNNLTFNLNPDLKLNSVTTGDTQINSNGLFINGGPSVTKNGIDAAGRQITNVAPGTRPTDAVNLSQLDDVDDNGSRGTASALAAAALPQAYTAGSNMITAGAGTYRGHNAVAIGYSSMSDNGKWLFKGSASLNKEDAGFSVGMGYMW
ncbi:MAG: hypothetical protein CSB32_01165 [Desulfobacterales bacterium]|nr:MAG: hypothetical protein CSB32_01165 [Desulfobacterales bacterium]